MYNDTDFWNNALYNRYGVALLLLVTTWNTHRPSLFY